MSFFRSLKERLHPHNNHDSELPPDWAPANEARHNLGKLSDATDDEYLKAEDFGARFPVEQPKLLPSHVVDQIGHVGCGAWTIEHPASPRFRGHLDNDSKRGAGRTTVTTDPKCESVCLLSNLPFIAGLYDIQGKTGVYYEILIQRMDGIIAIGTACRPYPDWRFPGWNRLSAGFHLDDFRKFFEDPDGGRDYTDSITAIRPGDTIGCGYEFETGELFYTYNGHRLPPAFQGIYFPRHTQDVYAAIGVEGACTFQINFGTDVFRWKAGNEWAWRVEGHVGRMTGSSSGGDDELPAYGT